MNDSCSMCGSPIPEGQGGICSMCAGDIAHGSDGYYQNWAEQQERDHWEQEAEDEASE